MYLFRVLESSHAENGFRQACDKKFPPNMNLSLFYKCVKSGKFSDNSKDICNVCGRVI